MKSVDLTLPSPQDNLAFDEALVDECEEGYDHEILRFWEPRQYFVVLGYSNRVAAEVHVDVCRENNIPIFRRYSGGGTVVQGPGCLNFSLILRIPNSGPLSTITGTNSFILHRHMNALQPFVAEMIEVMGHSDLAIRKLKFSGNAQRRKHRFLLFHGSFLLHFDIALVEKLLALPAKQPSYRNNRSHAEFMINLNIQAPVVQEAIRKAWDATENIDHIPEQRIDRLVTCRYSSRDWNFRF